jgi:hypothetical protein
VPPALHTKDELVKLATLLIVEEALEGEAGDALARSSSMQSELNRKIKYRESYRDPTCCWSPMLRCRDARR